MPVSASKQSYTWLELRQRILQRNGQRLSIRLEEEFWEQLEFSAKEEGLKLTDLVFRLIAEFPAENRSSLLRTYCARWMRSKFLQSQLVTNNADIHGILTSCPIPCVIVTREKKLAAQNSAFTERILGSLVVPDQLDEADKVVRFSLGRPIDRIFLELEERGEKYVETNVAFSRGTAIVQLVGRFCMLNLKPSDNAPLLCYLYSHTR